jgi:hypothetical protein
MATILGNLEAREAGVSSMCGCDHKWNYIYPYIYMDLQFRRPGKCPGHFPTVFFTRAWKRIEALVVKKIL